MHHIAGEMAKLTRKKADIWLMGSTEDHFGYAKLPTRGEVLRVWFDFHTLRNQSLDDSVKETVAMVLSIWKEHVFQRGLRIMFGTSYDIRNGKTSKNIWWKSETEEGNGIRSRILCRIFLTLCIKMP